MAKILTPDKLGSTLNQIVSEFDHLTQAKINKGIKLSLFKSWGDIIKATPVAEKNGGRARQSWFIGKSVTNKVASSGGTNNALSKIPNNLLGKKLFLYNNLPYIKTLEFGEYSRANSGDAGSKVTSLGFSKQAPRGMVRINVLKWPRILRGILKRL